MLPEDFRWQRAHQPRSAAGLLRLSEEAEEALATKAREPLDLRPYMDTGAVTALEGCPATQCFELFMKLGLRHLPVLDLAHEVVGIITRQELTTDFYVESILSRTNTPRESILSSVSNAGY